MPYLKNSFLQYKPKKGKNKAVEQLENRAQIFIPIKRAFQRPQHTSKEAKALLITTCFTKV
jgi:hypothetical protein